MSSRLSRLVAHPNIFRLFMKWKFDALAQRVQNWIVTCNFTVSLIRRLLTWWKGCEKTSKNRQLQYWEWWFLKIFYQPFHNINGILIKGFSCSLLAFRGTPSSESRRNIVFGWSLSTTTSRPRTVGRIVLAHAKMSPYKVVFQNARKKEKIWPQLHIWDLL